MGKGACVLLLALAPALAFGAVPVAILLGLEALGSTVIQMTILVIVIYGNLWAYHHIRRAIGMKGGHGRR